MLKSVDDAAKKVPIKAELFFSILPLVLAVLSATSFTLRTYFLDLVAKAAAASKNPPVGPPPQEWWDVPMFIVGLALSVLAVAAQIVKVVYDVNKKRSQAVLLSEAKSNAVVSGEAAVQATSALTVAMRDALQPLAENIAEMPSMKPSVGRSHLRTVATSATGALYALLATRVPDVRTNVFVLNADGKQMRNSAHSGRGGTPSAFLASTPNGKAAIEFIAGQQSVLYENLDVKAPPTWPGSRSGYKTFISVPIFARRSVGDDSVYGMVTVDSCQANSLRDVDLHTVELVADMVATAFAIAENAAAKPVTSRSGSVG
ncbi:GAF domain-containing protein [Salinibacterium soli]|uniref:GAF domain-containing protein n=1 Tax=Antiquaquibacter soli TaxID=3064523 RepID=A0ABT9BR94_9MICO|nr:GAF domain-containing protein [Protaetiibacter sp. WY-16]MDO7882326.1 GAF domain-containing protein [Protaetiibacter sp. WY-16]